jgi:hypothetical protein
MSEKDGVDLCVTDPGFEADLFIFTDLRTMTAVWMGDLSLKSAVASGRIDLDGAPELKRSLRSWLQLSSLASEPNQNAARKISFPAMVT